MLELPAGVDAFQKLHLPIDNIWHAICVPFEFNPEYLLSMILCLIRMVEMGKDALLSNRLDDHGERNPALYSQEVILLRVERECHCWQDTSLCAHCQYAGPMSRQRQRLAIKVPRPVPNNFCHIVYPIVAEKPVYATFLSPRRCRRYSLRVTSLPLSVNRRRPSGLVSRPASWINRWRTDAASMKIQWGARLGVVPR
jgi:hypothetical protein